MLFSKKPHGELDNKKVGILGYGRIGKELAKNSLFSIQIQL